MEERDAMDKPIEQWSEADICEKFGLPKSKAIVYRKRGESGVKTYPVDSMRVVKLDSDGKVGSIVVEANGESHRICSLYLKEMQSPSFSFDSKAD